MFRSLLGVALLFAVVAVVAPSEAVAQGCGISLCYHTCPLNKRIITDGSPHNSIFEPDFECHWGTCGSCSVEEEDDNLDPRLDDRLIEVALEAIQRRDAGRLVTFARDERVHVNFERKALQIAHGCNADWVRVSMRLPEGLFQLVVAALDVPSTVALSDRPVR